MTLYFKLVDGFNWFYRKRRAMKSYPQPQDYPVTDRPLVPIHSITTNAWLTLTTVDLS